jgi:uncharacterized membrane protein
MKIELNYINVKVWIIPIVLLIISAIAFSFLPHEIVCQWDFSGNVTNTANRIIVFAIPIILMVVLFTSNIIPIIDPKKEAYGKIRKEYNALHLFVLIVCFIGQIYMILNALGINIPLSTKLFSCISGGVFIFIGNILPKIPQNYLTGVKSVWAYNDENIWTKTQRFAGKLWFAAGLLMIILVFIPYSLSIIKNIIIVACVISPRIYSMVLHISISKTS